VKKVVDGVSAISLASHCEFSFGDISFRLFRENIYFVSLLVMGVAS